MRTFWPNTDPAKITVSAKNRIAVFMVPLQAVNCRFPQLVEYTWYAGGDFLDVMKARLCGGVPPRTSHSERDIDGGNISGGSTNHGQLLRERHDSVSALSDSYCVIGLTVMT